MQTTRKNPVPTPLERYVEMLQKSGYRRVLEIPFTMPGDRLEKFCVFYNATDGILFKFDTYLEYRLNAGNFYFNWQCSIPEEDVYRLRILPEGHWSSKEGRRNVFVGNDYVSPGGHDIRTVTIALRQRGRFVTPWIERPPIDLSHPGDQCGNSLSARQLVTKDRMRMLPASVRSAMAL